ncbi:MAG: hypothetical protein GC160_23075 [Acidobacteria bacterium]|nr:hypothetical protein [Acidobacteriota bacterium]
MDLDPYLLLAAFGGGVFGASIGALPAFILCGFATLVGAAIQASGGGAVVLDQVAFGPFLGPHIAFGGGVGAAAYAARRGLLPTGRDVSASLMGLERADVLAVGGAFGAFGALFEAGWGAMGLRDWTDTIALTVVVSAVLARLAFGRRGLFAARFAATDEDVWLPWQRKPALLVLAGLGMGLPSAWAALAMGAEGGGAVVGFGLTAASLTFLYGGAKMPVTHHIALPAAAAALSFDCLIAGGLAGILGAFLGEAAARLLLNGGDSHIDPPAAAIATAILLIRLAA